LRLRNVTGSREDGTASWFELKVIVEIGSVPGIQVERLYLLHKRRKRPRADGLLEEEETIIELTAIY
jgi:hypothetical protein